MDENEIKVSVYCTAYNHGNYIRDALEGFVNQITNFKYEVIIHDDASTDDTANIIREYANKYPDIIKPIFQTENQYSKGVKIGETFLWPSMKGKYIASCEGDDYWTDMHKLQIQADFLDSHPDYSACVHNTIRKDMISGKEELMFCHSRDENVELKDVAMRGLSAYHISSLMYRREFNDNMPDFLYAVNEVGDYPKSIYLVLNGKVWFINKTMSVYRRGVEGSWTKRILLDNNKMIETWQQQCTMLKMADDYSGHKYTEIFDEAILTNQYKIAVRRKDYETLHSEKFIDMYKRDSLRLRLSFFAEKYFPGALKIYHRLKAFCLHKTV